ncbi:branched-chain amino acid ABC transporter permease [Roseisalinus antarcticus]|uniref:High-affinity branched-chain amino acid transport system permease protein LivH n=1 Tax=Roseisalinus antarcticus TaxID=254357 RepID=A0A1Y5U0K8_9RHOB|nr:branched-chain amino acid ABC transporter permease [Roseisalinus antarcticus]SLN77930.1 High-affinity branched-chain amino acid transport system permease protein LivH [Roseisalinus antarcticus]
MTQIDTDLAMDAAAEPAPNISRRVFITVLIAACVLFPLLQVFVGGMNYYLHMLLFLFMNIAIASNWNIIGGYTGYISLGHNVFFAIGGYAGAILFAYFGISPFIAFPICGIVTMLLGFLIGSITLRASGPTFIISSIALVLLVRILLENWEYIGGTNGISLELVDLPVEYVKFPFYYLMLLLAVGSVAMSMAIRRSKFGLGLRAISQDEIKAEVAGVPTRRYKVLAFGLSGLFIGMAGALWGYYLTYLSPVIFLSILVGAKFVLMTILGGRGTVSGPVVGAIVFILANEFFVSQFGATELNIAATGLALVVVLLFFPEGIIGTLKEKDRLPKFLDWD